MPRTSRRTVESAFVMIDVVGSIALTLIMLTVFTIAVQQYAVAQQYNETRRQLHAAAETEMSRLRAGITPLPADGDAVTKTAGLITTETTAEPGRDEWRGLTLVRVVARKLEGAGSASVVVSAYLAQPEGQP